MCVRVCESLTGQPETPTITQLCLIPPGLGAIILELNDSFFAYCSSLFFCFCLRFQLRVCSHCASSALLCGTERWRGRRREWTDVTVSRCRSSQTLTHFHSAHHKRPAVFICLGAVPVSSGRVTFSRGVGFHCLPLTRARPQPPVCVLVHLCVDVVS